MKFLASLLALILLCCTTASAAPPDARLEVLDAPFYLAKYPDLKAAFGSNVEAAQSHWLNNGIRECRQSSATFSLTDYLQNYPDLKQAFGSNCEAALSHWLTYGKKEGRNPAPPVLFTVTATNPGNLGLLTGKTPAGSEIRCGCTQGTCWSACSVQVASGTKLQIAAVPPQPEKLGLWRAWISEAERQRRYLTRDKSDPSCPGTLLKPDLCEITVDGDKIVAHTFRYLETSDHPQTNGSIHQEWLCLSPSARMDWATKWDELEDCSIATVTAVPAKDYRFQSWGLECSGQGSTCKTIRPSFTVATFIYEPVKYEVALTVKPEAGGRLVLKRPMILPARLADIPLPLDCGCVDGKCTKNCRMSMVHDTKAPIYAQPSAGYEVDTWTCPATVKQDKEYSYCDLTLDGNKSVSVTFRKKP